jgi:hypothetical protein
MSDSNKKESEIPEQQQQVKQVNKPWSLNLHYSNWFGAAKTPRQESEERFARIIWRDADERHQATSPQYEIPVTNPNWSPTVRPYRKFDVSHEETDYKIRNLVKWFGYKYGAIAGLSTFALLRYSRPSVKYHKLALMGHTATSALMFFVVAGFMYDMDASMRGYAHTPLLEDTFVGDYLCPNLLLEMKKYENNPKFKGYYKDPQTAALQSLILWEQNCWTRMKLKPEIAKSYGIDVPQLPSKQQQSWYKLW